MTTIKLSFTAGKIVKSIGRGIKGVVRTIGRAARGLVCGLLGCDGGTTIVTDPYAEQRYLMEKERTKLETISFCYNTCAKEWGSWSRCSQP